MIKMRIKVQGTLQGVRGGRYVIKYNGYIGWVSGTWQF